MEIIEIGAVMVEAGSFEVVAEFDSFVRPVRHPKLTPFCTQLTSIRQEDVDGAPPFKEAVSAFKKWLYRYSDFAFCSWGDYDRRQLEQDCNFHNEPYPIGAKHLNVKKLFTQRQGLATKPGLEQAVKRAGLEFAGTHHRGIDDARNIARVLPFAVGNAKLPSRTGDDRAMEHRHRHGVWTSKR